jgi:NTE family protein
MGLSSSNQQQQQQISTEKVKEYEYLVLSGGGVKGICYSGALKVLQEKGILYDKDNNLKFKGIAATSFGALIGALLAMGYMPAEIEQKLKDMNFETVLEYKTWHYMNVITVLENYGLNTGDHLYNMLGGLVKEKMGNADYTLKQLHEEKGIKLVVVGTNMNTGKSVYFYAGNKDVCYSDIPIRLAVRISMCVPLLFKPVVYKDDYWLDGGVLDNYALHCFDGAYPGDIKARLNLCPANDKVLGLHIVPNDEEVNYSIIKRCEINRFPDFFMAFINTMLYENDRRMMTPSYWKRTVSIVTPAYPVTQVALTDAQKEELVAVGAKCTIEFLNKVDK